MKKLYGSAARDARIQTEHALRRLRSLYERAVFDTASTESLWLAAIRHVENALICCSFGVLVVESYRNEISAAAATLAKIPALDCA